MPYLLRTIHSFDILSFSIPLKISYYTFTLGYRPFLSLPNALYLAPSIMDLILKVNSLSIRDPADIFHFVYLPITRTAVRTTHWSDLKHSVQNFKGSSFLCFSIEVKMLWMGKTVILPSKIDLSVFTRVVDKTSISSFRWPTLYVYLNTIARATNRVGIRTEVVGFIEKITVFWTCFLAPKNIIFTLFIFTFHQ